MEEKTPLSQVYDDTTYFIDSIVSDYDIVTGILGLMRDGNATLELKKRYLLRAIDETWVNIIEDTLPSLDTIIRNPGKFIEEREEVIPIEFARNTTSRSMQHLSQHTNLISSYENGNITPTKILNVFREETMMTYENKFINTLISRLYAFVNRRYEIAKKAGQDEKTTSIDFKEDFEHGPVHVKLNFRVEISESATDDDDKVERNYTFTSDLWRRVEKLNNIVTMYANSEFCQNMGHNYIRPPVMRTNMILKNKNFRQCLALWQFIESYDEAGYSMLIQEDLEKVDESYIKELYSTLALQYLIFRYNIHNEFDSSSTLVSEITDSVLNPRIVDQLSGATSQEFDIPTEERVAPPPALSRYINLTPEDQLMLDSLDVALEAVEIIRKNNDEEYYDPAQIPEPEADKEIEADREKRIAEAKKAAEEAAAAEAAAAEAAAAEAAAAEAAAAEAAAAEAAAEGNAEAAESSEEAAAEEGAAEAAADTGAEPSAEGTEQQASAEDAEVSNEDAPADDGGASEEAAGSGSAPLED